MFYIILLLLTLILNNADCVHLLCYFYTNTEDCRRWFSTLGLIVGQSYVFLVTN